MLTLIMNVTIFEVYEAESRVNTLDVLLEKDKKKANHKSIYCVVYKKIKYDLRTSGYCFLKILLASTPS